MKREMLLLLLALLPIMGMAQRTASTTEQLTVGKVKRDLVGHKLSEGLADGYHEEGWTYTVKKGSVSRFKMLKVVKKTPTRYIFVAQMRLAEKYFSYKAVCQISYQRMKNKTWKLDNVRSMGLHVMSSHEYDDCIRASVVEDGWGGTYCLKLTNTSEMTLAVGGSFQTPDGWYHYAKPVKGHESVTVGGLFFGGSVQDYRILFVVRTE